MHILKPKPENFPLDSVGLTFDYWPYLTELECHVKLVGSILIILCGVGGFLINPTTPVLGLIGGVVGLVLGYVYSVFTNAEPPL